MELILLPLGIVSLVGIVFWLRTLYVRVSPDEMAILVGKGKIRSLRTSGFRKPITEDVHWLDLKSFRVDVKTSDYIPTHDFMPTMVDANVTLKIDTRGNLNDGEGLINEEGLRYGLPVAVENFIGAENTGEYITQLTQDILEGNLREIIGTMTLEEMVKDRKGLAERVFKNAVPDLEGLGLQIMTFNIQNFNDRNDIISKLGAENEEEITKKAELVKTRAEEEKAIVRAESERKKHEAQINTERANAEHNQQLALQKAQLETERAKAQAEAEAAQALEKARQDKQIETERAEVARIKSENDIKIRENEAKANERIKIDNQLYAKQKEAEAILEKAKAEAKATELKGSADAEAIRKRQEAMAEFSNADLRLKELEALMTISKNLSEPIGAIDNITMYGGNGTEFMSSMTQMMNQFTNATGDSGFNLQSLIGGAAASKILLSDTNEATIKVDDDVTTEETEV